MNLASRLFDSVRISTPSIPNLEVLTAQRGTFNLTLMQTESNITFESLQLARPILDALARKNYTHPSPIQARAIPPLLQGRDLVGCAQTGTGKTAAFSLPILHLLAAQTKRAEPKKPRCLILTPTRELAAQIVENITAYGHHLPLRHTVIFGGVGERPQITAMQRGVDILVATPGRLLDLMGQGHIHLDHVGIFVLDEADRMLDMGFVHDVKKVMARLPKKRQSLLFSATMPPAIRELADGLLNNPISVEVTPPASTVDRIEQVVAHVRKSDKLSLLAHFVEQHPEGLILVFSRTKHGANKLAEKLDQSGFPSAAIHGNKSQGARQRALEDFRSGKVRVLIATDIAARGIDVKGITLVINYDLPEDAESYVHRIGRTARAGAEGQAIAFCDPSERAWLRDIERLIRKRIPVLKDYPYAIDPDQVPEEAPAKRGGRGGGRTSGGPRRQASSSPRGGSGSSGGSGGGHWRRPSSRSRSRSRSY